MDTCEQPSTESMKTTRGSSFCFHRTCVFHTRILPSIQAVAAKKGPSPISLDPEKLSTFQALPHAKKAEGCTEGGGMIHLMLFSPRG